MAKRISILLVAVSASVWASAALADGPKHHHHFPKDIDAFHSILAPIWHARPGQERSRDACAKAAEMEKSAKDIRSTDAKMLLASLAALKSRCEATPADIDAALFDVHEAFHGLIDAKPAAAKR